jgi:hypothetical protein
MRKALLAGVLTLTLCVSSVSAQGLSPTSSQSASVPLVAYSWPLSGLLNTFGPETGPADWWIRRAVSDAMNFLCTPQLQLAYHPLLDPNIGPFVSLFHKVRYWNALDIIANQPMPLTGVRVIKFYSSGFVVQGRDPQNPSHVINVGFDISDGPFAPNIVAPFLVPIEMNQVEALADELDALFVSHSHADHISPYLIQQMGLRGKPVVVPQDIKNVALAQGVTWAQYLEVPQQGVTYTLGPIQFTAYEGLQYMGFLDAGATIGDPSNPFNVNNNAYLVSFAGKTIAHFGDNNDGGIVPWASQMLSQGWYPDVVFNLGLFASQLSPMFAPLARFQSHNLELTHSGNHFQGLLTPMTPPSPGDLIGLNWGESYEVQ